MDLDIKDLRVLVTAGAGGIGLAIARAFAAEGARVHTCDVDEMALSELAASDPAITATPCDVSDRAAVEIPSPIPASAYRRRSRSPDRKRSCRAGCT